MGENKIIVVANQKGGVGKSTICMSLANYLTKELKFRVGAIIDSDPQQSVMKKRKTDRERTEGTPQTAYYEVISFDIRNFTKIPDLSEELRKTDMMYIFDTPGFLDQAVSTQLLIADIILCPFNFDTLIIDSTARFLIFWNNLKEFAIQSQNRQTFPKVYLIPMMKDDRIGTKKELELWNDIRKDFSRSAIITPQINYCADMKRCDTMELTPLQRKAVQRTFDFIIENIYNPNSEQTQNADEDEQSDTES